MKNLFIYFIDQVIDNNESMYINPAILFVPKLSEYIMHINTIFI